MISVNHGNSTTNFTTNSTAFLTSLAPAADETNSLVWTIVGSVAGIAALGIAIYIYKKPKEEDFTQMEGGKK